MKLVPPALLVLVAGAAPGQTPGTTAQLEFAKLEQAYKEANRAYTRKLNAVMDSAEFKRLQERARQGPDPEARAGLSALVEAVRRPAAADWAPRFKAGADRYSGTEGAVPFLIWLVKYGEGQDAEAAVDRIREHHAASPRMTDLIDSLGRLGWKVGHERARAVATAIIEQNPDRTIQGEAYFGRSQNYGTVEGRRTVLTEQDEASRAADIARCLQLAPDSLSAMHANAPRFYQERLQIGMVAPDIVGEDLDGVEFRLSDYRGKVVVLDFWGDW